MKYELTQKDYDDSCDGLKLEVESLMVETGSESIAMSIALGNKAITEALYNFQEVINPSVEKLGIKTKTLSEVFGIEIKLTVNN